MVIDKISKYVKHHKGLFIILKEFYDYQLIGNNIICKPALLFDKLVKYLYSMECDHKSDDIYHHVLDYASTSNISLYQFLVNNEKFIEKYEELLSTCNKKAAKSQRNRRNGTVWIPTSTAQFGSDIRISVEEEEF